MGEIVDLDNFRKQREEEEKAKAEEEARRAEEEERQRAADEQAQLDYMSEVLTKLMKGLSMGASGSMITYSTDDTSFYESYTPYYTHEAGYDDDGYYEKTWDYELDPSGPPDDEQDI